MVVATDDRVLQSKGICIPCSVPSMTYVTSSVVAGDRGVGFISASMLLEELRIAYKGNRHYYTFIISS